MTSYVHDLIVHIHEYWYLHCLFIDTILPYLNKTVDSPIASQCPSSNSQSTSTGTEDVDINSLLDDVSHCRCIYWYEVMQCSQN